MGTACNLIWKKNYEKLCANIEKEDVRQLKKVHPKLYFWSRHDEKLGKLSNEKIDILDSFGGLKRRKFSTEPSVAIVGTSHKLTGLPRRCLSRQQHSSAETRSYRKDCVSPLPNNKGRIHYRKRAGTAPRRKRRFFPKNTDETSHVSILH